MIRLKAIQVFVAAIFSFALLFPIVVQTIHAFEGHEHLICDDYSTHLHKKQLDCSICDFHFFSFDFTPQNFSEVLVAVEIHHVSKLIFFAETFAGVPHFQLRAPPFLS